jgi:hypothetical protein
VGVAWVGGGGSAPEAGVKGHGEGLLRREYTPSEIPRGPRTRAPHVGNRTWFLTETGEQCEGQKILEGVYGRAAGQKPNLPALIECRTTSPSLTPSHPFLLYGRHGPFLIGAPVSPCWRTCTRTAPLRPLAAPPPDAPTPFNAAMQDTLYLFWSSCMPASAPAFPCLRTYTRTAPLRPLATPSRALPCSGRCPRRCVRRWPIRGRDQRACG